MATDKSTYLWGGLGLLGGVVVGAAAGLLLAPKGGSETLDDIAQWRRINRKKALSWLSSIGDALPARVKAAAGIGALKSGTKEAVEMSMDGAKHYMGT